MESITEAVLRFQDTGSGYQEVINRISMLVYHFPARVNILSEEDKSEFYLSFYNRIEGLINNFSYKGIPFETLLNQTLKWHIKTYLTKKKNEHKILAVNIQEEEVKIRNMFTESAEFKIPECAKIQFKSKASKKRLLFLVLMDSPNITDLELKSFSDLTGYEYDWLLFLKDTLNNRLHKRSERLTMLREKRNNAYMKLLYKQSRYSEEIEPEKKRKLELQIERLKKRLDDTRYEISRVPCRPTHIEIAELLKVPKGTVDSGLYYFRKRYNSSIDENSYSLFL